MDNGFNELDRCSVASQGSVYSCYSRQDSGVERSDSSDDISEDMGTTFDSMENTSADDGDASTESSDDSTDGSAHTSSSVDGSDDSDFSASS